MSALCWERMVTCTSMEKLKPKMSRSVDVLEVES